MRKPRSVPPPATVHLPYAGAAGGIDALLSSFQALKEQGIVALGTKTMLKANQPEGFDCPGCAWPDRNPHSTFEFCENGVKAVAAEATRKRVGPEFFARHSVATLREWSDEALEAAGRLTAPMLLAAGATHYQPIGWDAAFEHIGAALRSLPDPNQAIFYTSGRTSNEAAFLYQLFVREYGTNNLPDCSNMCHEPSGVALGEQIGTGKGTVTLDDFEAAQAILVFGQNPGTNHPRMLGELRDAAKRGCRIVVFNPLKERGLERFVHPQHPLEMLSGKGTRLATHYFQPRIGGDWAIAAALCKWVLAQGTPDHVFIDTHCSGFADFAAAMAALEWPALEAAAGLPRADLEAAARVYDQSTATILCWGMGITQHRHAVATIQMLVNLLLLKGNIGRRGAGPCPVRGHSNVQGDRTMGIWEKPSAAFLARLGKVFAFSPPQAHGFDVIAAIEAMAAGRARVFFAMGGNFAAATPDTELTARALAQCALTVQVSTKLNRSHLVCGREALLLPCLGRTEIDLQAGGPQAVSVEDSMSMVHLSTGMNVPASPWLKSEPAIIAGVASATLPHSRTPWASLVADYDRIRDRIAEVVEGFTDFNRRLAQPGGFHLRNSAREREWRTADGRARFLAPAWPYGSVPAPDAGVLQLMTVRSHDQYNTTVYGQNDRYRGIHAARRVCLISADDLARLGLAAGQRVDLLGVADDGVERVARDFVLVEYAIPAGCIASYFPETNVLVPLAHHAERARTPASKSIPVRLRPAAA